MMTKKSIIKIPRSTKRQKGFTLIELLVVIGIIALAALAISPYILNTLERRSLESQSRSILTSLQRAKFRAVKTKLNHRVVFDDSSGNLVYYLEQETAAGQWDEVIGIMRKTTPSKLNVTLSLPAGNTIEFSPLGYITNFTANTNSITVKSSNLERLGMEDLRIISVFAGGSIKYEKSSSGG